MRTVGCSITINVFTFLYFFFRFFYFIWTHKMIAQFIDSIFLLELLPFYFVLINLSTQFVWKININFTYKKIPFPSKSDFGNFSLKFPLTSHHIETQCKLFSRLFFSACNRWVTVMGAAIHCKIFIEAMGTDCTRIWKFNYYTITAIIALSVIRIIR